MLFINNKYTKWYYQIIEAAIAHPSTGYTEKHHIIPKSLGGSDDPENILPLSARQHFVCHTLLVKMTTKTSHQHKMIRALWAMTTLEYTGRQDRHKNNSKSYNRARILYSKYMSKHNPMHNPEIQAKRVATWKENRAKKSHIPVRILKDKFITPCGIFKTKKSIQEKLMIPEHTLNTIYNNLDDLPTNNGRCSKKIDHLDIDFTKSWRDNGFGYI